MIDKLKQLGKVKIAIALSIIVILSLCIAIYIMIKPYFSSDIKVVNKTDKIDNNIENSINTELTDENEEIQFNFSDIYKTEKKEDKIINILLCGMDARHYEDKSRSDTIILASYNRTKHTVKLVSFMRDSWVYLPERGWSRINSATAYGGIGLLVNTVNYNFDLDIQDYIQIKFDDFKIVVDAIGGIDVELTDKEIRYINNKLHVEDNDYKNDIKAKPGIVHLNGAQALWHCRNRTIGHSDYERTERQREVLTIIINKLLKANIGQLTKLVIDLREHVNTNLSLDEIFKICSDALIYKKLSIENSRIPFDGMYRSANKNGASVLEIDIDKNTKELHKFLGYSIEDELEDENNLGNSSEDEKVKPNEVKDNTESKEANTAGIKEDTEKDQVKPNEVKDNTESKEANTAGIKEDTEKDQVKPNGIKDNIQVDKNLGPEDTEVNLEDTEFNQTNKEDNLEENKTNTNTQDDMTEENKE